MPKNGRIEEDDEFKEEDLDSDDDEKVRRRRKNKKDESNKRPKILDDTYMPSSKKHLRACVHCQLVMNREKWNKIGACPNCPQSQGIEDTTDNFESLMASIFPKVSWVAKWQRMQKLIPGFYALAIKTNLKQD